jgi:hypothetical protein
VALAAVVAGCTPDIAPGSYLCGPEMLCPDGLACNGGVDDDPSTPDNVCVVPNQAQPFACGNVDPAGDDTPDTGPSLGNLTCVSPVAERRNCLLSSDVGDWYQLDIPDNCVAVQIEARLSFPVAFEPVQLQIASDGGAPVPAETPCSTPSGDEDGSVVHCFKLTVQNGSHHALGVVHAGTQNCGGACANNRYTLAVQLSTP